jgi:hypothetical protein
VGALLIQNYEFRIQKHGAVCVKHRLSRDEFQGFQKRFARFLPKRLFELIIRAAKAAFGLRLRPFLGP